VSGNRASPSSARIRATGKLRINCGLKVSGGGPSPVASSMQSRGLGPRRIPQRTGRMGVNRDLVDLTNTELEPEVQRAVRLEQLPFRSSVSGVPLTHGDGDGVRRSENGCRRNGETHESPLKFLEFSFGSAADRRCSWRSLTHRR
jgi:hypothetical protein